MSRNQSQPFPQLVPPARGQQVDSTSHQADPSQTGSSFATGIGNIARTIWESVLNPARTRSNESESGVQSAAADGRNENAQQASSQQAQQAPIGAPAQVGRAILEPELPIEAQQARSSGGVPSIVYYSLPFSALDGRQALLAIPGNFLPIMQVPAEEADSQARSSGQAGTQRVRITVLAPATPIFVPLGSSFLPFSWLYDPSGWGWPIISLQQGNPPPGLPLPNDPRRAHFLAGPPFPIRITMTDGPDGFQAEEQPNPEHAKTFVDSLETADEELRSRMARLGIGDIGACGGDEGELGCPVCLDPYDESSDRPEWVGGEEAKDHHVVVIPCKGFHSLHRRCLLDWLASKPPSQWSCPMCRSSITPSSLLKNRPRASGAEPSGQPMSSIHPPSDESLKKELAAHSRSLREEIHRRENQQGYLCDYLACFPDYERHNDEEDLDRSIVTLKPCGHRLHLDCLTTSLRIANGFGNKTGLEPEDTEDEDEDEDSDTESSPVKMVGRWVECPVDRKEVWTMIPVSKKRRGASLADGSHTESALANDRAEERGSVGTAVPGLAPIEGRTVDTARGLGTPQVCGQVQCLSISPDDANHVQSTLGSPDPHARLNKRQYCDPNLDDVD